ncbi:MAG: hypothetical protein WAM85_20940 [Terracidiphilus sp.]
MSFDLFQLVPAVYRLRDAQIAQSMQLLTPAEQAALAALQALVPPLSADQQAELDVLTAKAARGPLESLLMVIDEQLAAMAGDLDQLYDDQFIETCAPWVIPYIGDLIGYQSIQGITAAVDNPRSEVANTISMRRRKGTVLVLEQLARDVTGWGAHAVEFFRILGDTEYMKHVRGENFYTPNLRRWEPRLYMNTGFDKTAHKADVHSITNGLGPYNIQNIGIFLWSLGAYSITQGTPTPASTNTPGAAFCYRFSSLGMDMPLFHRAVSQGEQITTAATPSNVPAPLRRLVLCADMQKGVGSQYYGPGSSLALYLDNQLLNPYQVQVADLSGADGSWANVPAAGSTYGALVDPELGRIALPPVAAGDSSPIVTASYYYGFNAEMGGGEYARGDGFTVTNEEWVFPYPDTATVPRYTDLRGALNFVIGEIALEGEVALEITSSETLTLAGGAPISIDLPAGATLELRAADGTRPTLLLDAEMVATGDASSTLIVNGLVIGGIAAMAPGSPAPAALVHVPMLRPDGSANLLSELNFLHCTLVPGWSVTTAGQPVYGTSPALIAEPAGVEIVGSCSILGSVRAAELVTVSFSDSIVDATDRTNVAYAALDGESGGGALTLTGCTVVGKVHAEELTLVSDSIVWAALSATDTWASGLVADRKQVGCVRFSFLPVNAITPRRFKCVEEALASAQPIFFTLEYGRPGYLKMLACTANSIRRGADDGGEMGAFHFVLGPLRESDLNVRLQEYLPVGLDVGLAYQS